VLASFSVVPVAPESPEQALARLELIKAEQEQSFADKCDKIPGWREAFDAAYEKARMATDVVLIESINGSDAPAPVN
jgi:hypothetical protein